ncbi:unnamed protein product [Lampetra planeri]
MRRRDGPVIATSQCNDRSRKAPGPREARGDLRGAAGVERGAGRELADGIKNTTTSHPPPRCAINASFILPKDANAATICALKRDSSKLQTAWIGAEQE